VDAIAKRKLKVILVIQVKGEDEDDF
jgi:hypothetical protein